MFAKKGKLKKHQCFNWITGAINRKITVSTSSFAVVSQPSAANHHEVRCAQENKQVKTLIKGNLVKKKKCFSLI